MRQAIAAEILSVNPDGPASRHGLRPGDVIVSLNGCPLRDVIDYRFHAADERVEVVAVRGGREFSVVIDKEAGTDLGLELTAATCDGIRRCRNRCLFCFVDRLPRGLRRSLYVKDDDYRYSFLFGSYVTLTNLGGEDWERLVSQRLSPLYVSVHATDLALRRRLLGNPAAPDVLSQLRVLAEAGIRVHAQIVLCPTLNDGVQLERTIADLADLHGGVQSIAIVPVGLTRFGPPDGPRRLTLDEMAAVVQRARAWQRLYRRTLGRGLVYLADEFYLATGASVPGARHYDGYPQYENGVGMARVLLDEWSHLRRRLRPGLLPGTRLGVVSGELAAPLLRGVLADLSAITGVATRLHVVRNNLFGPRVTVAGLLTAEDVISQVKPNLWGDVVALPRAMFDGEGLRTLDEASVSTIEDALGVPVIVAATMRELLRRLAELPARAAG